MNAEREDRWRRDGFRLSRPIQTRWLDVDAYGHVNNAQYYGYFDSAVNGWLIEQGLLDPAASDPFGVVAETGCRFFSEIRFPQIIEAGVRVARIGRSSVAYEIALFVEGAAEPCAQGRFVHVYVDRATRRPAELPEPVRAALEKLKR